MSCRGILYLWPRDKDDELSGVPTDYQKNFQSLKSLNSADVPPEALEDNMTS